MACGVCLLHGRALSIGQKGFSGLLFGIPQRFLFITRRAFELYFLNLVTFLNVNGEPGENKNFKNWES